MADRFAHCFASVEILVISLAQSDIARHCINIQIIMKLILFCLAILAAFNALQVASHKPRQRPVYVVPASKHVKRNSTLPPVVVGLYYESRCVDSRFFWMYQMKPSYALLTDIAKFELVPFGKARVVNGTMHCQHGPNECDGNRLMACVQAKAKRQVDAVNTVSCLFERRKSDRECIDTHLRDVKYEDVDECRTSSESMQMMVENQKLTGSINYVPTISINGVRSAQIQAHCEYDFQKCIETHHNGTFYTSIAEHPASDMMPSTPGPLAESG